ncbi:hypothetical protein VTN77DRAFT_3636 [Rasamsonia byssochlamydoides]|uniref:uncharacterized protein n=1 Tax=Rasamsonia byssochlamydoides TaxID=89139 RepID=UPI0037446C94
MMLMAQARQAATFDPEKLTIVIHDNEETVRSRRAAFHRVESALGLLDNMKLPKVYAGLNREELYLHGLERAAAIMNDMLDHRHRHFEVLNERYQLSNATPFGLNFVMFRKTIELQGTPEQQAYWLPLIDKMQINGAYAQTELAHGSFVRGIETTATFDPATDEFVINSPTLTSTKYWPGAIGLSCSHAIVMARLITQGKDYGVHPFVVQFRSLEDYTPMPGVELGDIGIKMAYNGTCNGYARFNGVRVPRNGLLMAHAQVLRDGSYVRPSADVAYSKLSYATMMYIRGVIVRAASFSLAQALTIAARYSTVREQGLGPNAGLSEEVTVITYKSQHYRLLTLISQAYAILFASKDFDQHYQTLTQQQKDGNHSRLPFTHALSCGLKAWSTTLACAGVEEARKLCGGHGYVAMSGLPEILATVSATVTFEGENYVLWQQLVRYLFQRVDALYAGKEIEPDLEYISQEFPRYFSSNDQPRCPAWGAQLCESDTLLSIFRHRSLRLLAAAHRDFTQAMRQDQMSMPDAWNKCMMEIINAGRAHVDYVALCSFHNRVAMIVESSLKPVLEHLASLFALTTITNPNSSNALSFVEDGHLSLAQLDQMRAHVNDLLVQLYPDIIALTDAWDFTDASLCSAIGARDGNVYERLMAWTRQLPVNQHANEQGGMLVEPWEQTIKPMLRGRL